MPIKGQVRSTASGARNAGAKTPAGASSSAGFKPLDRFDHRTDARCLSARSDRGPEVEGLRTWLNRKLAKAKPAKSSRKKASSIRELRIGETTHLLSTTIPESRKDTIELNDDYFDGSTRPIAHYSTQAGVRVPVYTQATLRVRAAKAQNAAKDVKKILRSMRRRIRADLGLGLRPSHRAELHEEAMVAAIIDHTSARVGSPANKNIGVTTLRSEHVLSEDGRIYLVYQGKSGKMQRRWISDPHLARLIGRRAAEASVGERLFPKVSPRSVRAYLARFGITPKAIRTFWANKQCEHRLGHYARVLNDDIEALGPHDQRRARQAIAARVVREVAAFLGNTPKIARDSYIDRSMLDDFTA